MLGDYKKVHAISDQIRKYRTMNGNLIHEKIILPKTSIVLGELQPNYRDLVSHPGGNATTKLEGVSYTMSNIAPIYRTQEIFFPNNSYESNDYHDLTDPDSFSDLLTNGETNHVEAECISQLTKYIRKKQTPFAAQIFLGELPEILQLLRNPLKSSKKVVEAFSSKRKRIKTNVKALSNLWLETRFAILPLISDINAIIDVYNQDITKIEKNKFYSYDSKIETSYYKNGNASGFYTMEDRFIEDKYQCFLRCGLIFERLDTHDDLKSYLESALKDNSNLALTAYELTPWSFLVDYFVNIGDIIAASTLAGIQLNYTSFSKVRTRTTKIISRDIELYPGMRFIQLPPAIEGRTNFTKRTVSRDQLSSIVPPLSFEIPSSGVKLANMAALIASSFK